MVIPRKNGMSSVDKPGDHENCLLEASAVFGDKFWATACDGFLRLGQTKLPTHGVVRTLNVDPNGRTLAWMDAHDPDTFGVHLARREQDSSRWQK